MADPADQQILSIIERILRLKADGDDIAADVKEVYAEAKANGLNKTALGEIVTMRRKQAKNPTKVAVVSADVELYLAAIERAEASHTHAPARERNAA